jgi:hypothetical protein
MTTPLQYPLVTGTRHSFVSIEANIAGLVIPIKSINYSRTRTRGLIRGNHPDPLGKTQGTNEYKADFELFLAEWNLLQATLQAQAAGYGDVSFPVFVNYSENGFDMIQDQIIGCTLDTADASNSEGSDGTTRKSELNPLKILFQGLDDLAAPLVTRFIQS